MVLRPSYIIWELPFPELSTPAPRGRILAVFLLFWLCRVLDPYSVDLVIGLIPAMHLKIIPRPRQVSVSLAAVGLPWTALHSRSRTWMVNLMLQRQTVTSVLSNRFVWRVTTRSMGHWALMILDTPSSSSLSLCPPVQFRVWCITSLIATTLLLFSVSH